MTITADTRIATIIKANAAALEAIISLSPAFEKLRNPFFRKVLASQASVKMAARIGNCSVFDFLKKLEGIGFTVKNVSDSTSLVDVKPLISEQKIIQVIDLDVRELIHNSANPLPLILSEIYKLKPGEALRVINSFEPVPLINLMERKGFRASTERLSHTLFHTTFVRTEAKETIELNPVEQESVDHWDEILANAGEVKFLDVRNLAMPKPMISILGKIQNMEPQQVLYVYHKKIPVLLLPELKDRLFEYRLKQISKDEVHIIIFKCTK